MIKKIVFISMVAALIVCGAGIYVYRHEIIRRTAEVVVRDFLPDYVKIGGLHIDFKGNRVGLTGFRVLNPSGFSERYLLEASEVYCDYRLIGKTLFDGIEVLVVVIERPVLTIERLSDGRINSDEFRKMVESSAAGRAKGQGKAKAGSAAKSAKKMTAPIKLPETYSIKKGKIAFIDNLQLAKPHRITLEKVDATVTAKFDSASEKVVNISSTGQGDVNGAPFQVLRWVVAFHPETPKLTMSNRLEASDVDILPFEPYYDRYSPFVFRSGKFSGTLVFDFDNGNIGSTNEVRLSKLEFDVKKDFENAQLWEASTQDLVKYFSSSFGDIVFDFKIKGDIEKPRFYLGPISKKALTSMTIDKISEAIQEAAKSSGKEGAVAASGEKSDIEKAAEYLEALQGMMKKK
ncbi:MAG: DUF748 domain-containing protein [Candidatus Omnitrophica bacterium]|nr:DUF748 domain-containing protein [Candidatus Omnitrophota bacterium]